MDYIIGKEGTKIAYYVYGEGFPIFIFNGFTCSEPSVRFLVNNLSKKYKVIFWDYKGHGQSETPEQFTNATVEGAMDDARRIIEKLQIKKAIFLGYSAGVQVMIEYYFRYPGIATSLICISGFTERVLDSFLNMDTSFFANVGETLKKLSPILPRAFFVIWRWIHGLPFELRYFIATKTFLNENKTIKENLRPFLDNLQNQDLNLLIHFLMDLHNHPLSRPLQSIALPTLIIAGGKDLFAPKKKSEELHHKINQSEFMVIPEASHNILQEEFDTLSQRILEFLSKHNL